MHIFNEFIQCEYKRDEILFDENDEFDYIYFIKSGEIEISVNMSLLELNQFIQEMSKNSNMYNLMKEGYVLKSEVKSDRVLTELKRKQRIKVIILLLYC